MHWKQKVFPVFFNAIVNGRKTFEYRKFEGMIKVGDYVTWMEFFKDQDAPSGREVTTLVTFVYRSEKTMPSGYCIISFKIVKNNSITEKLADIEAKTGEYTFEQLRNINRQLLEISRNLEHQVESDRFFNMRLHDFVEDLLPVLDEENAKEAEKIIFALQKRQEEDV